jgi:hypothetical protein
MINLHSHTAFHAEKPSQVSGDRHPPHVLFIRALQRCLRARQTAYLTCVPQTTHTTHSDQAIRCPFCQGPLDVKSSVATPVSRIPRVCARSLANWEFAESLFVPQVSTYFAYSSMH